MTIQFKEYTLYITDDSNYTLNSTDNIASYSLVYSDGKMNSDRGYVMSKHGIRIFNGEKELTSALVCEPGGRTTIHENSFILANDSLLICCADKIYSLAIPTLQIQWKRRFDPATCLAIYPFKNDFIIHGELQITRIDSEGNEKWGFSGRDIFITPKGENAIELLDDKIKLLDWEGYEYILNADGQVITSKTPRIL